MKRNIKTHSFCGGFDKCQVWFEIIVVVEFRRFNLRCEWNTMLYASTNIGFWVREDMKFGRNTKSHLNCCNSYRGWVHPNFVISGVNHGFWPNARNVVFVHTFGAFNILVEILVCDVRKQYEWMLWSLTCSLWACTNRSTCDFCVAMVNGACKLKNYMLLGSQIKKACPMFRSTHWIRYI